MTTKETPEQSLTDAEESFQPQDKDGYVRISSLDTGKKVLLHPMNILFPEGGVTAILGPSGAGKSSLSEYSTD